MYHENRAVLKNIFWSRSIKAEGVVNCLKYKNENILKKLFLLLQNSIKINEKSGPSMIHCP